MAITMDLDVGSVGLHVLRALGRCGCFVAVHLIHAVAVVSWAFIHFVSIHLKMATLA